MAAFSTGSVLRCWRSLFLIWKKAFVMGPFFRGRSLHREVSDSSWTVSGLLFRETRHRPSSSHSRARTASQGVLDPAETCICGSEGPRRRNSPGVTDTGFRLRPKRG